MAVSEEALKEARIRYEAGEPMTAIAKSLQLHRTALNRIRDKECWSVSVDCVSDTETKTQIKKRIQADVIDISTRKAVERVIESGAVDRLAEATVLDLLGDARITNKLVEAGIATIDEYLAGTIVAGVNQNKADVLKSIVSANKAIFELRRMMAGKTAGDASIEMGPKLDPNITLTVKRLPTTLEGYERSKSA